MLVSWLYFYNDSKVESYTLIFVLISMNTCFFQINGGFENSFGFTPGHFSA